MENQLPTTNIRWSPYIVVGANVLSLTLVGGFVGQMLYRGEEQLAQLTLFFAAASYAFVILISSSSYTHGIRIASCVSTVAIILLLVINSHMQSVASSGIICIFLTWITCRAFIYKCKKFKIAAGMTEADVEPSVQDWMIGLWIFSGLMFSIGRLPPLYFAEPLWKIKSINNILNIRVILSLAPTVVAMLFLLHSAVRQIVKDQASLAKIRRDVMERLDSNTMVGRLLGGLRTLVNAPVWMARFLKFVLMRAWRILSTQWFPPFLLKAMARIAASVAAIFMLFLAANLFSFSAAASLSPVEISLQGNLYRLIVIGIQSILIASALAWLGYIWLKFWNTDHLTEKATFVLSGLWLADSILLVLYKFNVFLCPSFATAGPFFFAIFLVIFLAFSFDFWLSKRQNPHQEEGDR